MRTCLAPALDEHGGLARADARRSATALRPACTRGAATPADSDGTTTALVRTRGEVPEKARRAHVRVAGNSADQPPSAPVVALVTVRQPCVVADLDLDAPARHAGARGVGQPPVRPRRAAGTRTTARSAAASAPPGRRRSPAGARSSAARARRPARGCAGAARRAGRRGMPWSSRRGGPRCARTSRGAARVAVGAAAGRGRRSRCPRPARRAAAASTPAGGRSRRAPRRSAGRR